MHCKIDVNFNESLTNDIVSFEQLGPEILSLYKPYCRETKILKNNQSKKMAAVVELLVVVVILVVEVVEIVVVVVVVVIEVVVVVVVVVCWCSCWKTEAALYFEEVMVIVIEIGVSSRAQRGLPIDKIPGQTDARKACSCKFRQPVTTKAAVCEQNAQSPL